MKSGDRAAGDRDEDEWKHLAGEDRAGAVDELRDRRHLDVGIQDHDPMASATIVPIFMNVRQIIARREQQPDRQHRGANP